MTNKNHVVKPFSLSPTGESFPLPGKADYNNELIRIEELAHQARSESKEIVVVMGLGCRFQVPSPKFQVAGFKFDKRDED